ncbi:hypothetical protein AAIK30_005786, partial [Escherichia coli]|nr:hypothetical protein [Shigella sonnei]
CDSDPVVINRYISVEAPRLERLRRLVPRTVQRRLPTPEHVSSIIGVLTAKPSRKRRKNRTEPYRIIDTFQRQLATAQTSLDLLPQYDTDIESRANELWKKAVHTINNTTREERRVCYITLNRPEEEHSGPEDIPSVKAILNTLLPLEMLLPVPDLTASPPHKKNVAQTPSGGKQESRKKRF